MAADRQTDKQTLSYVGINSESNLSKQKEKYNLLDLIQLIKGLFLFLLF